MPTYFLSLTCTGFAYPMKSGTIATGCYITRRVEAENLEIALPKAIKELMTDPRFEEVLQHNPQQGLKPEDQFQFELTEIKKLSWWNLFFGLYLNGFLFFNEEQPFIVR